MRDQQISRSVNLDRYAKAIGKFQERVL